MNEEQVRNIADILALSGNAEMSAALCESRDLSTVKVHPILRESGSAATVEEFMRRNPDCNLQASETLFYNEKQMLVVEVCGNEVLLHKSLAEQIKRQLSTVL